MFDFNFIDSILSDRVDKLLLGFNRYPFVYMQCVSFVCFFCVFVVNEIVAFPGTDARNV